MNKTNKDDISIKRSYFLVKLSLGLSALAATAAGIPVISALLAPLLRQPSQTWRDIGDIDHFNIGTTQLVKFENPDPEPWAGVTAHSAAWVRRESDLTLIAFSVNCTHLGCPVRWEKGAQLFMCPCHGGVYYKDGSVASGPPPKGLIRYPVRIDNGKVQLMTQPLPITTIEA
jgi:menaquinol-cytochrome c reductase iron-sulfur subunit